MFDRNKRDSNSESGTFPPFEAREPVKNHEPRPRTREAAVIGPSIQINGDLSGEEDLIIQGKVKGTIQLREKSLTVGSQGQVEANLLAHTIIVEGEVNGDLFGSERVSILKTGNVRGNIVSPKVSLEEGCRFKGSIDMDQKMINKTFAKTDTSATIDKPQPSAPQSKGVENSKQPKPGTSATGGGEAKSGTMA